MILVPLQMCLLVCAHIRVVAAAYTGCLEPGFRIISQWSFLWLVFWLYIRYLIMWKRDCENQSGDRCILKHFCRFTSIITLLNLHSIMFPWFLSISTNHIDQSDEVYFDLIHCFFYNSRTSFLKLVSKNARYFYSLKE